MKIIAVAAAALAVAACSAPNAVTTTVTETVTAPQSSPRDEPRDEPRDTGQSDDDLYIGLLASKGVVAGRADSIEVGHMVCDALDDGYTGVDMVSVAKASGFTTEQGAAIVAAAVLAYCPWNEDQATS